MAARRSPEPARRAPEPNAAAHGCDPAQLICAARFLVRMTEGEYAALRADGEVQRLLASLFDAAGLGSPLLPAPSERAAFERIFLLAGSPHRLVPVESLHRRWSRQPSPAVGAARGLYLSDSAEHLRSLFAALGIEVPSRFSATPDHLALELELLSLILERGTRGQARIFVLDHLGWLDDYLERIDEQTRLVRAAGQASGVPFARLAGPLAFHRVLVAALIAFGDSVLLSAGREHDGKDAPIREMEEKHAS